MKAKKRRDYTNVARSHDREYSTSRHFDEIFENPDGSRTKRNKRSHNFTVEGHFRNPSFGDAVWHPVSRSGTINLEDNVTYGPDIPGWRDKMRQGIGVVTSLSGTRVQLKVGYGGEATNFPTSTGFNTNGSEGACNGPLGVFGLLPGPTVTTITSDTALQQARSRLLKSYIEETQSFSGGKFLAELKDSIELVTHPVRSIYNKTWEFAGDVKRIGKVFQHRPRTAAAALSESWLAYSFGVKPFVQDANAAASALNRLVQNPRNNLRYVQGTGHDRSTSVKTTTTAILGCDFRNEVRSSVDCSVRLRGAFRQMPTGTGNLLAEFGLGVFDILPSIWEGIPWSFFVDYFANVGECLDAWRMINVDQAWLIRTVRNRTTMTSTPIPYGEHSPGERFYTVSGNGRAEAVATYVNRSETAFLGETPNFQLKLPGTSATRWLNITALIGVINDSRWGSRPTLDNTLKPKPPVPYLGAL